MPIITNSSIPRVASTNRIRNLLITNDQYVRLNANRSLKSPITAHSTAAAAATATVGTNASLPWFHAIDEINSNSYKAQFVSLNFTTAGTDATTMQQQPQQQERQLMADNHRKGELVQHNICNFINSNHDNNNYNVISKNGYNNNNNYMNLTNMVSNTQRNTVDQLNGNDLLLAQAEVRFRFRITENPMNVV